MSNGCKVSQLIVKINNTMYLQLYPAIYTSFYKFLLHGGRTKDDKMIALFWPMRRTCSVLVPRHLFPYLYRTPEGTGEIPLLSYFQATTWKLFADRGVVPFLVSGDKSSFLWASGRHLSLSFDSGYFSTFYSNVW